MNKSHDEKKYGVAAILDEKTIIINYGEKDGAKIGSRINVLSSHKEPITDPFTNEPLGYIHHIKAELTISMVEDKFSYCVSKKQLNTNDFNIGLGSKIYLNNVLRVDSKYLTREITDEPIKVKDSIEIFRT